MDRDPIYQPQRPYHYSTTPKYIVEPALDFKLGREEQRASDFSFGPGPKQPNQNRSSLNHYSQSEIPHHSYIANKNIFKVGLR